MFASAGVIRPFLKLQGLQEVTKFSQVPPPPRHFGMT